MVILSAAFEDDLMAMSRAKSSDGMVGQRWLDEAFQAEHPDLYEFLTEVKWDDGKNRVTGTLILAVEGRSVKCKVCDRDGKRGAWITAETMAELFRRIDQALHHDDLDWRKETR